ncbi:MAG: LuxR C-terminal-related transcriptional regulator [Roseovarius sp.]
MQFTPTELSATLVEIAGAEDVDSAWENLHKLIWNNGFDASLAVYNDHVGEAGADPLTMSRFPMARNQDISTEAVASSLGLERMFFSLQGQDDQQHSVVSSGHPVILTTDDEVCAELGCRTAVAYGFTDIGPTGMTMAICFASQLPRKSFTRKFGTARYEYGVAAFTLARALSRLRQQAIVAALDLSDSQIRIMQMIADGHSTKEIAFQTGVTQQAVSKALRKIAKRFNTPTRSGVVARAAQLRLLAPQVMGGYEGMIREASGS